MRADFVNEVAKRLGIKRPDLVEKDLILHQILTDLSKDELFGPNFLLKGGTCLIKCYFGYLRFSEDIDFTWKDQSVFIGKSQKRVRAYLGKLINNTGRVFEKIAQKRELDFKCVKSNHDYVELGGGNKTCTLKIWYESDILKRRSFVKVTINFVETMCFAPEKGELSGLLIGTHEELETLCPEETAEYAQKVQLRVYDIREILCEKVRALLTREGTKARDFLDVYFICTRSGIKLESVEDCILKKIRFALKLYQRYRTNLKEKIPSLKSGKLFEWGAEKALVLGNFNEAEFYSFLNEFKGFLTKLLTELGYEV